MGKAITVMILFHLVGISLILFLIALFPVFDYSDKIINQNKYKEAILYVDSLKSLSGYYRSPNVILYYGKVNQINKVVYFGDISGKEMTKEKTIPIWYIENKYFTRNSIVYRSHKEKKFEDKTPNYTINLIINFLVCMFPVLVYRLIIYLTKKGNYLGS